MGPSGNHCGRDIWAWLSLSGLTLVVSKTAHGSKMLARARESQPAGEGVLRVWQARPSGHHYHHKLKSGYNQAARHPHRVCGEVSQVSHEFDTLIFNPRPNAGDGAIRMIKFLAADDKVEDSGSEEELEFGVRVVQDEEEGEQCFEDHAGLCQVIVDLGAGAAILLAWTCRQGQTFWRKHHGCRMHRGRGSPSRGTRTSASSSRLRMGERFSSIRKRILLKKLCSQSSPMGNSWKVVGGLTAVTIHWSLEQPRKARCGLR